MRILALMSILLVAVALYAVLAFKVAPEMVAAAYHGESSFEFLNALFARQPPRPLELYVSYAKTSLFWIGMLFASGVCITFLVQEPRFQRWWEQRFGPAPEESPLSEISRLRRAVICTSIVGFLAAAAIAALVNVELWPFSPYTMYANSRPRQGPAVSHYRLYGVTETVPELEVWFDFSEPIDQPYRAENVLGSWSKRQLSDDKLQQAMEQLLVVYHAEQEQRVRPGPVYKSLRLYREEWDSLDPHGADRAVPNRRALLVETTKKF
ncbi:hypothetical protein [Roseimaritima ulvae]|nr:hypothetical protein [Roseimaritima ulvae]